MSKAKLNKNQIKKTTLYSRYKDIIKIIFSLFLYVNLIIIMLLFYLPDTIDPVIYSLNSPPILSDAIEPNNLLERAQRKAENQVYGPESFCSCNGDIYISSQKGIYRETPIGVEFIAKIGEGPCDSFQDEDRCGRPLGLECHNKALFVADSYLGIHKINLTDLKITPMLDASQMENANIKFVNSLQISPSTGDIYFTSSSTRWTRKEFVFALVEARPDGRVYKLNHNSGNLELQVDFLRFPNGLLLSPNQEYLLIAELIKYQIVKYYLDGPLKGTLEVFSQNLPFPPDNLRYNSHHNILSGGALFRTQGRFSLLDTLAPYPEFKRYAFKLLDPSWFRALLPKYGIVAEIDGTTGQIVRTWHDPSGKHVYDVSEAFEMNPHTLYIGSFSTPFYSVLKI